MSFFKRVNLDNYRNFDQFSIDLDKNCNVLFGKNGSGKTNILESISLCERGSGFRKDKINNLIRYNSQNNYFNIKNIFVDNQNNEIDILLFSQIKNEKIKKIISINGSTSNDSISYFENKFSIISFLPEIERLFLSSPSIRRNFLDKLIYGVDKNYLKELLTYKKKIFERSKILKNNFFDKEWIEKIEIDIVNLGTAIYRKRKEHIDVLNSLLNLSKKLINTIFQIEIRIKNSILFENLKSDQEIKSVYLDALKESRNIDSILGGCKIGPHKSDIFGINLLNNIDVSQYSTGQQKTIVLLIIIAQCRYLIDTVKRDPIILFDEVCSHLDKDNRDLLLELIDSMNVQTIMTGTEESFFSFLSTKATYCNINKIK